MSAEARAAFRRTRAPARWPGEALANVKYHWRVGDKIPLQATIFPQKNGSNTWTFDLVGTYHLADPKRKDQEQALFFNWDYFDEGARWTMATSAGTSSK